jgi:hypothetical protein
MVRRYFYFDTTYRTCTNRELPIPRISPASVRPRELSPLVAAGCFLLRSKFGRDFRAKSRTEGIGSLVTCPSTT